jgi:hypothetical protein
MEPKRCYLLILRQLDMNRPVNSLLNGELNLLGFKVRGAYWFRHRDEVTDVVGLQKSQYGVQSYINLAIWVKLLGEMKYPRVQDCHIQCRLENFVPECADDLAKALDEEDLWKMDNEQRREILKLSLCSADFLFFNELSNFNKIQFNIRNGLISKCAIAKDLTDKVK